MTEAQINSLLESLKIMVNNSTVNNKNSTAKSSYNSDIDYASGDFERKLLQQKLKYSKELRKEREKIQNIDKKTELLLESESKIEEKNLSILEKKLKIEELNKKLTENLTRGQKSYYKGRITIQNKLIEKEKEELEFNKKKHEELIKQEEKLIEKEKLREKLKAKAHETFSKIAESANQKILSFGKKILDKALEQDSVMSKLSANYALTSSESLKLKVNLSKAAETTSLIGIDAAELAKMQASYTDELGRAVMLSKDGLISLSRMAVATGLGAEEAAKMASEMELFGYGAESTAKSIEELMLKSKKMGMSSSAMTKKMQENLKIANSYTFKGGIKGVQEMTLYSNKFRINMQTIAGLADKVSNPEGAIETAASLQVLGGSFAQMSDPMKLLNQGINDMEGLTKTYNQMLKGIAKVNKETGEVQINGYDRLRLKAAAEAMGVSLDEAMETARTSAKRDAMAVDLNLNPVIKGNEEAKDLIASLGQFKNGKFQVTVGGQTKAIAELSKEDIQALQPKDDSLNLKTVAENTLGLKDVIENGINSLIQTMITKLLPVMENIAEWIQGIFRKVTGLFGGDKGGSAMGNLGKGAGKVVGKTAMSKLAKFLGGNIDWTAKGGAKIAGTQAGKMAFKSIPVLGGLFDLGFAISDFIKGDTAGGFMNLAAGGAGMLDLVVPGLGSTLSSAIDVANMARMIGQAQPVQDVLIPSKGRAVKLDDKDDVFAAKPGGAIVEALSPSTNIKKTFGGVAKSYSGSYSGRSNDRINLTIDGTITLNGGGSATKISATELIKDRNFVRELTRIIGNQMSRDANGGKFEGGLNNNSF